MNKTKMSPRKVVLLVALVVLLGFIVVIKGPLQSQLNSLNTQYEDLEGDLATLQPYADQMDKWQKELDELYARKGSNIHSIPDYNNIDAVLEEMGIIFDGDSEYTINFSNPTLSDHIVTRDIKITFSCYSYAEVMDKLNAINNSTNRYRINDMTVSEGSEEYFDVSINLIVYEYCESNELKSVR